MSKDVNKWTLARLTEEEDDVLSTVILTDLQIDEDFVWIEKTSFEATSEDHLDSTSNHKPKTETVNVAQHYSNTENNESPEEWQMQSEIADTESETMIPTEWDRELTVEQQYLEQYGPVVQRANSSRPKYHASQRLSVRQLNHIANNKVISRDPSYYKLDSSSTSTLKQLLDKNYVCAYHNVVGNGTNSVVIYATSPPGYGVAVKIYKLSNDVKKNNALLKRAQKEYAHLRLIHYQSFTPYATHIVKNVIIFHFMGADQETLPSISRLPSEYSKDLYRVLVKTIHLWYTMFNMVHGKLCTKNILFDIISEYYSLQHWLHYSGGTPCRPQIIGLAHSVRREHPKALVKLMRDCHFITNFFKQRDVPVKSTEELFKDITGLDKISSKVLDVINKKDLWQKGLLTNPNRQNLKT